MMSICPLHHFRGRVSREPEFGREYQPHQQRKNETKLLNVDYPYPNALFANSMFGREDVPVWSVPFAGIAHPQATNLKVLASGSSELSSAELCSLPAFPKNHNMLKSWCLHNIDSMDRNYRRISFLWVKYLNTKKNYNQSSRLKCVFGHRGTSIRMT